MPQGDQRGAGWQFYDASYDGIWDGSLLRQGLGQLTDGKLGPDNFKASYYEQDRGTSRSEPIFTCHPICPSHCFNGKSLQTFPFLGWVGWRNDSRNGQPIEIVFEFDTVRDFTSLSLYVNNQFTKDVQVYR